MDHCSLSFNLSYRKLSTNRWPLTKERNTYRPSIYTEFSLRGVGKELVIITVWPVEIRLDFHDQSTEFLYSY